MSKLDALKTATSRRDVARLLGFVPQALSYILYKQPAAEKYSTFQIPKRSGGERTIKAPGKELKLLQRRLSDLLQDCVEEINSITKRKDRAAHGFKRKRSIITNAHQHRHRRYIFNLDLEDFFPSINLGRVRGFFINNRDFQLHKDVATTIAQIACHDNSLPQGSPCSPIISNLIGAILDIHLIKLASAAGCTYSRYADDITFSTNKKEFPSGIAVKLETEKGQPHVWLPGRELQHIIERTGFRINPAKTHLMYRQSRQKVTGLIVNKKVNVEWEYRHNVRAMVHKLVRTGSFEIYGAVRKAGVLTVEKRLGSLKELHGMLGFIDTIDLHNREREPKNKAATPDRLSSSESAYQRFLMYADFYAADTPVVICEGETDTIYLTHAIRNLAAEYPQLAEVKDGKIRIKVRLFKHPRSSATRILQLNDGGASVLGNFIVNYKKVTRTFTAPEQQQNPVVLLYDDDDGAKTIKNIIRRNAGVKFTSTDTFVRIIKNLYALAIPCLPGQPTSKIEDCFDEQTRSTEIDGKTLDVSNKGMDTEKHYGKKVFAHRVIQAKAHIIDFSGFRPLLANLVSVIDAHKSMTSSEI